MKIDKVNNTPSFGVRVDKNLIKSADKFFMDRKLVIQYDAFHKQLDKLELLGDDNSVVLHATRSTKKGMEHLVCLKNTAINNKEAVIMFKTDKYNEVLRFITRITSNILENCENALSKL